MQPTLELAEWPENRRFAYSITYDEGMVEVLGYAWRLQRDFGIPGHVSACPDRLGLLEGDSSAGFLQSLWNLRKYAEAGHLRSLLDEGWSVGCQYDGGQGSSQDAAALAGGRRRLEDAMGRAVNALAFADGVTWQANAGAARAAGYRWLLAVYDDLNQAGADDGVIRRSPLYHRGPVPNRLANDPYRLLATACDRGGWVVDVVRVVDRYPADPARDCTPAELEHRFRALRELGAGATWPASVTSVAAYRATRAAAQVTADPQDSAVWTLNLAPGDAPPPALTVLVRMAPGQDAPEVEIGAEQAAVWPTKEPGLWWFVCPVRDVVRLRVRRAGGGA